LISKAIFSASLLQSSVSHDLSEILQKSFMLRSLIWSFANATMTVIINVEMLLA